MDITVKIRNKHLSNPVGAASGTYGYGDEYSDLTDSGSIGAVYTKAVTLDPKAGNDVPRLIETPSGILNSIGLANVGADIFLKEKIPFLDTIPSAVIVNIAGSSSAEYSRVIEKLDSSETIWGYEINLSCPNVSKGCLAFGTDAANVRSLTAELRRLTEKPLIIKLTPNVTDIAETALAAEEGGADAVSCINTLVGMIINTETKKTVLPRGTGGLSGPAILPVGIASVYKVSRAVKIPVIGIGGIMNADNAVQYLLAGASAIQIGTGIFIDPGIPGKVLNGIIDYMNSNKLRSINDFHQYLK